MKILSINLGNFSSTGNIAQGIKYQAEKHGIEYVLAYPFDLGNKEIKPDDWLIGNRLGRKCSVALGMLTGFNGCFSLFATIRLLNRIDRYCPDIIHFHNLHNNYINLPLLFKYVKKKHIKVVWTLHDCWSFTGQCPYFDMNKCDKWQNGCHSCSRYKEYPKALVDNTKLMWKLKRKWFTGVEDLVIVTPSVWLSDLVKKSFLNKYPIRVINNGIDLSVFKPTVDELRTEYNLKPDEKVVLGVAFDWGKRKGLDVFVELSRLLPRGYRIVLVGIGENIETSIPDNIIKIKRTHSQHELAAIYTMADVFVNPTREENYPTVNMESLACGTPVVTFNTGGSPEIIDEQTGKTVGRDDINELVKGIIHFCSEDHSIREKCLQRARSFNRNDRFLEYIQLYEEIMLGRDQEN